MKIEAGKYYRTRDGRKVGPMVQNDYGEYADTHPWRDEDRFMTFRDDGAYGINPADVCQQDLIAEWTDEPETQPDTPKLWRDMTPEEKGALLLAHHEGRVIEVFIDGDWTSDEPEWFEVYAYRISPEPKRETVTIYTRWIERGWWSHERDEDDTYSIAFDLIDGQPDTASIRMEALK